MRVDNTYKLYKIVADPTMPSGIILAAGRRTLGPSDVSSGRDTIDIVEVLGVDIIPTSCR